MAGLEVMHGLKIWTCTHQSQPGYCHSWVSNIPAAETAMAVLNIAPCPGGDQPSNWRQVNYTGSIPSWKWQNFVLTGLDTFSGYRLAFPALKASDTYNYLWTCRMLYPPSWYSTQHCFWSRNSHHSKRSAAVGPCSWNSLFLPCPHHLQVLIWQNGGLPSEDSVTGPAGWQNPAGLDQDSPEGSIYSQPVSNI